MDVAAAQERIDAITWYHEFDFGNGLRTRPKRPGLHRSIWNFIETQLGEVDFRGKTVLDIGCWDGYWSFFAERRGAASVLATDDRTQNWSNNQGIHVAKDLLGSQVEINQDLSVYELSSLNRTFDVILCLGVYYHLLDPFYALAQIRHCCHAGSLVLIEGAVAFSLGANEVLYSLSNHAAEFLPDIGALRQLTRAAYLEEKACAFLDPPGQPTSPDYKPKVQAPPGRLGWRWRLATCQTVLSGSRPRIRGMMSVIQPPPPAPPAVDKTSSRRVFMTCVPKAGRNRAHDYKPPFGLHQYDDRFREPVGG
jgi:tRNA (mo5U34)-methyltransferase